MIKKVENGVSEEKKKLSCLAFTIFLLIPAGLFFLSFLDTPDIATGQTAENATIPKTDFNGDGYSDLAIGVDDEDIGSLHDAGGVNVIYGSSDGLGATAHSTGNGRDDQMWTQNSPDIEGDSGDDDYFGHSLAVSDFNKDGYSDLAIGVPGDDVGTIANAGAVNVIYGSSGGLRATALTPGDGREDQIWTQNSTDIEGDVQPDDDFGWKLMTGDFNKDGYSDLAVVVPFEDVGTIVDAGAVNVIYGSSDGLIATGSPPNNGREDQIWTQSSTAIEDDAEPEDWFGFALATGDFNKDGISDLAIGVLEDVGTVDGAGAVNVIYGSSDGLRATALSVGDGRDDQIWTQNSTGIEDDPEVDDLFGSALATGDFNKDGYSDLAIGVSEEDVSSVENTGAVNVIYGSSDGLRATSLSPGDGREDQIWTQNSTDIEGDSMIGDEFGYSLATGDFNKDGISDLAIGVPREDVDIIASAGAVNVIYGSSDGLRATALSPGDGREDQMWTQDSTDIEDNAEPNDGFGSALATGDFNNDTISDLTIGVPREGTVGTVGIIPDAGAVNTIYGSAVGVIIITGGLSATVPPDGMGRDDQIWMQNSPDIEGDPQEADRFGGSLA